MKSEGKEGKLDFWVLVLSSVFVEERLPRWRVMVADGAAAAKLKMGDGALPCFYFTD